MDNAFAGTSGTNHDTMASVVVVDISNGTMGMDFNDDFIGDFEFTACSAVDSSDDSTE